MTTEETAGRSASFPKEAQEFLDFVRGYSAGMALAFLALLRFARNVRHLQRLHELMPPNCQLLRPESIGLEAAWKALYTDGRPSKVQEPSDDEWRGRLGGALSW